MKLLIFIYVFILISSVTVTTTTTTTSDDSPPRVLFFGDSIFRCSGLNKNFEKGFLSFRLPLMKKLRQHLLLPSSSKKIENFVTVGQHKGCNKKFDTFLDSKSLFGGEEYDRHDSYFGRPLTTVLEKGELKKAILDHRPDLLIFNLGINDILMNGVGEHKLANSYQLVMELLEDLILKENIHNNKKKKNHSSSLLSRGILFLSILPLDVNRPKVHRKYYKASQRVKESNARIHQDFFSSTPILTCPLSLFPPSSFESISTYDEKSKSEPEYTLSVDNSSSSSSSEKNFLQVYSFCPKRISLKHRKSFSAGGVESENSVFFPPFYYLRVDQSGFLPRPMTYDAIHPNVAGEKFIASKVFPILAHLLSKNKNEKIVSLQELFSGKDDEKCVSEENKDLKMLIRGDSSFCQHSRNFERLQQQQQKQQVSQNAVDVAGTQESQIVVDDVAATQENSNQHNNKKKNKNKNLVDNKNTLLNNNNKNDGDESSSSSSSSDSSQLPLSNQISKTISDQLDLDYLFFIVMISFVILLLGKRGYL